jgi:hypothetical protein
MIKSFCVSFLLLTLLPSSIVTSDAENNIFDIDQNDILQDGTADQHLIYGYAEYSDGWTTTGALVYAVSEISTIIEGVYSPGNWQFDCSKEDTPWPVGTNFTVYIKGCCGHPGWFGKKQGTLPETNIDMGTIIAYPNKQPNAPSIIDFPPGLQVGSIGEFIVQGTDPDDLHEIKYRFDWDASGSHKRSNFTEYVENGESVMKKNTWDTPGTYIVKAQATDEFGLCSNWSEGIQITIYDSNYAPYAPVITGPDISQKYVEQSFDITTNDPENEQIYYQIQWGDNQTTNWLGPYDSGEILTISHGWTKAGFYDITARAKDTFEIVGAWSEPQEIQITEPFISIQNISIGLGKISFDLVNSGTGSTNNVSWSIIINGQRIFTGAETQGNVVELRSNEKTTLYSNFIFGFGLVFFKITATDDIYTSDEKNFDANLFAFFILT